MPRRISNGRPLLPGPGGGKARKSKKTKGKSTTKALNAFALAEEEVSRGKVSRMRGDNDELETSEPRGKRQRGGDLEGEVGEGGGDDDVSDAADGRPRKKRRDMDDAGGAGDESPSDSEEWHEGVGGADEDSDIDSDEAFGESDEERFADFTFRGSRKAARGDDEAGSDAEDNESLGSDAIDLAEALDQVSDDESEDGGDGSDSGSDEDEPSSAGSTDSDDNDDGADENDPSKLEALQGLITGFGGDDDKGKDDQTAPQRRAKVTLKDLGLSGVKDPHMKASLKLMSKEEKATQPGAAKKLDVPLAKRQQDRLVRSAAYDQSKKTLDRWTETVKKNRRADHLVFPLSQNAHDVGLDHSELMPVDQKRSTTELEQTILAIIEESGLGESGPKAENAQGDGDVAQEKKASRRELERQRRRERELFSREQARAKRIKKIKSKAWRRVHRKELLRDEEATKEAMLEAGELDSDGEREAEDRRRVLERVGVRHRDSKWAKLGKKAGRAVWDEEFRAGLTDLARKDEELRRRVEGRTAAGAEEVEEDDGDSDDDDVSDPGSESTKRRLLAKLDEAAAYHEDDEPKSALMQMKFMQRADEKRKRENDELVEQIRRELDSDNNEESEEVEDADVGRRQYGTTKQKTVVPGLLRTREDTDGAGGDGVGPVTERSQRQVKKASQTLSVPPPGPEELTSSGAGAWSRAGQEARKSKKARSAKVEELDLSAAAAAATLLAKPKKPRESTQGQEKTAKTANGDDASQYEEDDDEAFHLPTAIRDQELIKRAFAGEDVVGDFEREKQALIEEEGDKTIDETLPGWGSWVGEGVGKRVRRQQSGRFVKKVEGVQEKKRKDFRLQKVIISEKHVRKNDKYLASSLPFPFESRQQYEASLRQPVGPEWQTKQVFQDATKPRVIVKQGVIAPMSKPMY